MPHQVKPSGGRTFSKTCLIRGREAEGRKAILKRGQKTTRVASIAADGLTSNDGRTVPTVDILDIQTVETSSSIPTGPVRGVMGERGTVTSPSDMRRRHRLQPGSPILIEERGDEIVIQPAEIVPRRSDPRPTLEGLLAGVTAENIHGEVSTGPAVGREAW